MAWANWNLWGDNQLDANNDTTSAFSGHMRFEANTSAGTTTAGSTTLWTTPQFNNTTVWDTYQTSTTAATNTTLDLTTGQQWLNPTWSGTFAFSEVGKLKKIAILK